MKRIDLQSAYVLHRRPYRETSVILDVFTLEYGRLALIAKGVRQAKSQLSSLLQPFNPIFISWVGKSELMTLTHAERVGLEKALSGDCLFAGFYLNELLMSLLHKWDAYPALFQCYEKALIDMQDEAKLEPALRSFEINLLRELGYGILPKTEAALLRTFSEDKCYRFTYEQGFLVSEVNDPTLSSVFSGKQLMAIAREEWAVPLVLNDAKRLVRLVLAPLLNGRPIHSRKLFI